MGITIHYKGRFKKHASLPAMIEEVKDIATVYNWPYFIYDTDFPSNDFGKKEFDNNIYGIHFTPPESEPIWLSFFSNGRMSNIINKKLYANSTSAMEQRYLYMLFTKTQFAGAEIHKLIIHILKYIGKKYFAHFKVIDEGEYWETGDEKLLEENFRYLTQMINDFATALETFPREKNESFEDYFLKLMELIKNKK